MSFRHVLVPSDLTDPTLRALEEAIPLADADGGRVTLLHVIETIAGASFEELEAFYTDLEQKARASMEQFVVSASNDARVEIVQHVVYGRRAVEIVRFAGQQDVDLIVLASHAVDPAQPMLGTVSYKVSVMARCSVLLLR